MHQFRFVIRYSLFLLFFSLAFTAYSQPRQVITLHFNWKFSLGQNEHAFKKDFDDSKWASVTVPHDWAIAGPFIPEGDGNTGKLPWKGEGWYRYHWMMPKEMNRQRIILLFDGVMAFPKVYVNGLSAGEWDYGYNSFYLDITDHVLPGEDNVIAVHADTRDHDSRWYPGAGIFRKVQLIITDNIHIEIWGNHVTTPIIKSNYAKVNVVTTVTNRFQDFFSVSVEHIIFSPSGHEICRSSCDSYIPGLGSNEFAEMLTIPNPQLWDIDHPYMYTLLSIVKREDKIGFDMYTVDSVKTSFGIRTIRFTPDDGFFLNDHRVQLQGVCLHHDQGLLGGAFYPRSMERQLELLKSMGCNAIRTSHNPPAPELLELCDNMGILVIDELFDKYDRKADILDPFDFDRFAERNVKNFVRRDRNHPCIILWSVGNEIGDVQWNINGGFEKLRTMVNAVRTYDATRPVTLVCDSRNSATLRHFDYYDVHSWNYGRRYDLARQLEPNKAVVISESASTVSTRGYYDWPLNSWPLPQKKTEIRCDSLQVSSYDMNAPEWAEIPDDDFMWQQEERYIAGEFVWTGFDYLGEPTPFDNRSVKKFGKTDKDASVSSYFGIFDLTGIPKDRYYLYKSYWNDVDTTIHILPHWNWSGKEGQQIPVFVYTSGDCAELFLNGKSQGLNCKIPDSENSMERFRLMWNYVHYEPGELKAIAYKEGIKIGEEIVVTTGPPSKLRLTPDRKVLHADDMDLCYVTIEALDKNGNENPLANNLVSLKVSGAGKIAGIGNGNPQSFEPFQSDHVRLFYGKAMLILRSEMKKGTIEVSATSKGLNEDHTSIKVE